MARTIVWGLVIIGIGLWVWLAKLDIITGFDFSRDWPVFIIIIGVMTVVEGVSRLVRRRRRR